MMYADACQSMQPEYIIGYVAVNRHGTILDLHTDGLLPRYNVVHSIIKCCPIPYW